MTAVEQFFKDLCDLGFIEYPDDSLIQDRYNLALEMEKEQKELDYQSGYLDCYTQLYLRKLLGFGRVPESND